MKRLLLYILTMMFWFAQYVYAPFLTPYLTGTEKGLALSVTVAGYIGGVYGFSQLIFRIPISVYANILQRHKLFISIGLFLAGVSTLGLFLFQSPALLILSNAISGLASSMWACFTILFASYFDKDEGPKAIGIINSANNAGVLCGFVVGSLLIEYFDISVLFLASVVVGLLGFVLSFGLSREKISAAKLSVKDLLLVIQEKGLLFYSLLGALCQFVSFSTINFSITKYAADRFAVFGLPLGLCSAICTLSAIFGSYFTGAKLSVRFSKRKLIFIFFSMMGLYCALVAVCPNIYVLYLLQILAGFSNASLFALLMSSSVQQIPLEKKTAAMGFFQSIYSIGMTLGPIGMGAYIDFFKNSQAATPSSNGNPYFIPYLTVAAFCLVAAFASQIPGFRKMNPNG